MGNIPKPDRTNFKPNFVKTPEDDVLDIAWNEGILSDGRPFRVEYWCQDQVSNLTYFLSTKGLEGADKDYFVKMLEKEGLLEFKSDKKYVGFGKINDAAGNEMWSINITIGDEDEIYAEDKFPLRKY